MSRWEAFRRAKREVEQSFDSVEDWMHDACGDVPEQSQLDKADLDHAERVISARRRGLKFFAGGRSSDCGLFARFACSSLFEADPNRAAYGCAVQNVLRVAAQSVGPRTRHKLTLATGVIYFTADDRGALYVVGASADINVKRVFPFLFEASDLFKNINIHAGYRYQKVQISRVSTDAISGLEIASVATRGI